jgi:hypothetical protein
MKVTFAAVQFSCTWDIEGNLVSGALGKKGFRPIDMPRLCCRVLMSIPLAYIALWRASFT